jgi:hypothetical protein
LKPVVKTMEEVKAFIANEPITVKPLDMAPLGSVGATLGTAIPIKSTSFQPLGSNIQYILDDIKLEVDSKNSIRTEHEKARRPVLEGTEPPSLSPVVEEEHMIQDPTPKGARFLTPIKSQILTTTKSQTPIPPGVEAAPNTEASSSSSTTLIKPSGVVGLLEGIFPDLVVIFWGTHFRIRWI